MLQKKIIEFSFLPHIFGIIIFLVFLLTCEAAIAGRSGGYFGGGDGKSEWQGNWGHHNDGQLIMEKNEQQWRIPSQLNFKNPSRPETWEENAQPVDRKQLERLELRELSATPIQAPKK